MKRLLLAFIVLPTLLFPTLASANGCFSTAIGAGRCGICGPGMPSYRGHGSSCTACGGTCGFIFRASGNTQEDLDAEMRLIVQANARIIHAISEINPDAAMTLFIMSEHSKTVDIPVPTTGNTASPKLFTLQAVEMATSASLETMDVEPYLDDIQHDRKLRKITGEQGYSNTRWSFTKRPKRSSIAFSHRLLNGSNEEVAQLYPDITVTMVWQEAGSGGFWQVTDWTAQDWSPANSDTEE
ncbi:hypothetical protein [Halopseudomonas xiamenensis]|uniref:hypothetical protein n=1 Tax=Halopseudomonas xiamenensis TaxID=157792 RepID=UPI0016237529|nr:hypothetical protein [Halopseudomonas xiamenensis]